MDKPHYEMTPDEKAKNLSALFAEWHSEDMHMQSVLAARTAAGMCDTGEMAATMDAARERIAASAEAMQALYEVHIPGEADCHFWLTGAEARKWRADGCTLALCHCGQMDFSAANDDALTGIADQGDDFDAYMRQLCSDRPDGIIEHYSSATEGHC